MSDDALLERGLAAGSDVARCEVEYEMWRRQMALDRRAILVAEDAGAASEVTGRWAIALVLLAIALSLAPVLVAERDPTRQAFYLAYLFITLVTLAGAFRPLRRALKRRGATATDLREFDREAGTDQD